MHFACYENQFKVYTNKIYASSKIKAFRMTGFRNSLYKEGLEEASGIYIYQTFPWQIRRDLNFVTEADLEF